MTVTRRVFNEICISFLSPLMIKDFRTLSESLKLSMSHQNLHDLTGKYATKRNNEPINKPNEDYVICDNENGIYIICDGVSRSLVKDQYPIPSPAAEVSKLFATKVHDRLVGQKASKNPEKLLRESIELGNFAIAQYNRDRFEYIDYFSNDLAGTVAIVGILNKSSFFYCYIGDCVGYLFRGDNVRQFTEIQTSKIKEYKQISQLSKKEKTLAIRRDFRNNKNEYYSYGVFTGESSAFDFVKFGRFSVSENCSIIMISDGLLPYLQSDFKFSPDVSPDNFIKEAERIEKNLNLRSDDKSIIIIDSN